MVFFLFRSDFPELFDICADEDSGDNVDKNDNVGGGGGGGSSAPQTDCPGKEYYRVVKLISTPEMLYDRYLPIFSMKSLKQHMEYFYFRC